MWGIPVPDADDKTWRSLITTFHPPHLPCRCAPCGSWLSAPIPLRLCFLRPEAGRAGLTNFNGGGGGAMFPARAGAESHRKAKWVQMRAKTRAGSEQASTAQAWRPMYSQELHPAHKRGKQSRPHRCQAFMQLTAALRQHFPGRSIPISSNPDGVWSSSGHFWSTGLWRGFWQQSGSSRLPQMPQAD